MRLRLRRSKQRTRLRLLLLLLLLLMRRMGVRRRQGRLRLSQARALRVPPARWLRAHLQGCRPEMPEMGVKVLTASLLSVLRWCVLCWRGVLVCAAPLQL
jgi:hypothetical protein